MTVGPGPGDRLVGDKLVNGHYQALADATSDRLLALLTALATEVWTVRDRLRLLEGAIEREGLQVRAGIDTQRQEASDIAAMQADRDAFVERVFDALIPRTG